MQDVGDVGASPAVDRLVIVSDDGDPSLSDSTTVEVTVNPVNHAPVIDDVDAQELDEGEDLAFAATASDVDDDALNFSLDGAPDGADITDDGEFTNNGDGTYQYRIA